MPIEQLKKQDHAAVMNVSSVLGFVPMAVAALYSSTKAAIHSYTLSLRHQLKGSPVAVLEIAPPWVQTDLLNSNNEPRAMPLAEFISETIKVLGTGAQEVLLEQAKPFWIISNFSNFKFQNGREKGMSLLSPALSSVNGGEGVTAGAVPTLLKQGVNESYCGICPAPC